MIWQNPLAWLGLVTIALPILIHLLGQGRARRQPFPTLRFFGETRPLPTQRTRLHDLLLLVVRCGILAAAVAALAQPLWVTASRKSAVDNALVRAVLIDTSTSMQPAFDAALRAAQPIADSATSRLVLRTANPALAIPGAVSWIQRQSGRGELIVVSDFQLGTLDSVSLATVPPAIGVRLIRIPATRSPAAVEMGATTEGRDLTARISLTPDRTDVQWTQNAAVLGQSRHDVQLLAAPADMSRANAAWAAASAVAVRLPLDSVRNIAVVYPGSPERAALQQRSKPVEIAWMADLIARVNAGTPFTALADSSRLLIFTDAEPGSLASATLLAAVRRALSVAPPMAELEPSVVPDSALAAWQRLPAISGRVTPGDESDGRWLWVLALVLLGLEWILRRTSARPAVAEVAHDAAT